MALKKFKGALQLIYFVPAVILFVLFLWFVSLDYPPAITTLGLGFQEKLNLGILSVGLSNCHYEKTPYNCVSTRDCDEKCVGFELYGICFGKKVKTNCVNIEQCEYKTEWICEDPDPYYLNPDSNSGSNYEQTTKWCPSGTILTGDSCVNPYTDYKVKTPKREKRKEPTPKHKKYSKDTKKTRLVCGGDVVQNSYIMGWKYIQEQEITTTCKYDCWDSDCEVDCSDAITRVKVKDDCTQLCSGSGRFEKCIPRAKVCQDKSGTPICITYPLELKIQTILDKIQNILTQKE